ncbi:MAG TPA: peptide-binding protein [Spirochaetota bacterium]|nr:peptide-binding protein [Spirochaetota bacterium]HNT10937.1 peptide-binding protein [Spirochaetota bacterium]
MRIVIPAIILSLAALASCRDMSEVRPPDTLAIHMGAEPSHLNPITSTEAVASSINNYIYENLVDRDYDTLEIVPQLAERWTISPDRLRYVFHLKRGVVWSDGVEFTADDVVYSYERIKDPKVACAPLKVYYIDVTSCRALDRYTVEFVYSKRYFRALEICGGMPLVPKHVFNDGTDFNTHTKNRSPVGTGPYRFERWDTGKRIVLIANERYRGKKPAVRRVVYTIVAEINVALQMLKKGELDLMGVRPIQWVRQTNSESFLARYRKLKYFMPYFSYIGWNSRRAWFSDKRVRRALTHLVNREAILEKLEFGQGMVVSGDSYVFSKNYNQNIKPWPYDPAAARELLRQAGWVDSDRDGVLDKDGKKFSFTFTMSSGSKFAERLSTILKEDFAKAGIQMSINRYEWAVFVKKLHERDFDAVTLAWSLDWESDPYQLWHSSQVKDGSNYCGFVNREADGIIERVRAEFDPVARMRLLHRFHEILHEEQPYTFLYCTPALVVVSKRFNNVVVHTKGLRYDEWEPAGGAK